MFGDSSDGESGPSGKMALSDCFNPRGFAGAEAASVQILYECCCVGQVGRLQGGGIGRALGCWLEVQSPESIWSSVTLKKAGVVLVDVDMGGGELHLTLSVAYLAYGE
jgi:hypothetical protein